MRLNIFFLCVYNSDKYNAHKQCYILSLIIQLRINLYVNSYFRNGKKNK